VGGPGLSLPPVNPLRVPGLPGGAEWVTWRFDHVAIWPRRDLVHPLTSHLDSPAIMVCNSESVRRHGLGRFGNLMMWRLSLVIYLLLAVGMGNSSCCCTAARWSGWISTWGSSSASPPGTAASPCCGERTGRRTASASAGSAPDGWASPLEEPTGPPCDCPPGVCWGELSRPTGLPSSVVQADDLVRDLGVLLSRLDVDQFPQPFSETFPRTAPPPLSGREARISHCSWRC